MSFLRVIHDKTHDGAFNMAVDEFLFRRQIQRNDQNPILRFYQFSEPVLTIGYGMWRSGRWDMREPLPAIRRITGGGVVRHGSDLTYSIVAPLAEYRSLRKVRESYQFIHVALQYALKHVGVTTGLFGCHPPEARACHSERRLVERRTAAWSSGAGRSVRRREESTVADSSASPQNDRMLSCFDSPIPFDVMLDEKKIAGAGQKRSMGVLLHQGSIAWDILSKNHPDLELERFVRQFSSCLAGLFRLPIKEIPLHGEETREMKELSVA